MSENAFEIRVSQPHRVFLATADDILAGDVTSNPRGTTWRYFLVDSNNEVFAAAEVDGETLSNVNEGLFVQGSANAMIAAEQFAAGRAHDYELRLLSIPAVYTMAVWLKSPGEDVLFPSDPAPSPLVANEPYDEGRFTDALRPLAKQRREAGDMMA